MVKPQIKISPAKKRRDFLWESMNKELRLPKGENLLAPEKIDQYFEINNPRGPIFVVDIGLPRIASTARAILLGGENTGVDAVHFQPWKFIQRYALPLKAAGQDPKITINKNGQEKIIFLKETPGGPNDLKELFDPINTLLGKGVLPSQIKLMVGIREPFNQFLSWLKFDQSRQVSIYKQGLDFLLNLMKQYEGQGITVIPFVFELFYPDAKAYWSWIIRNLDLENIIRLPKDLMFSSNPRVIWHEADRRLDFLTTDTDVGSNYYSRVVQPVIDKKKFKVPPPKIPNISDLTHDDIALLKEASRIYYKQAIEFYDFARETGLPDNGPFNNFIEKYGKEIN